MEDVYVTSPGIMLLYIDVRLDIFIFRRDEYAPIGWRGWRRHHGKCEFLRDHQ